MAKNLRVFLVRINGEEVRVLAASSCEAITRGFQLLVPDGDVPAEGLMIFVKPSQHNHRVIEVAA